MAIILKKQTKGVYLIKLDKKRIKEDIFKIILQKNI